MSGRRRAAKSGEGRPTRTRAFTVIAVMAIAGGLVVEAGRGAQAQDAQETYARTARPATPIVTAVDFTQEP